MKSERGVTLTSIMIYVVALTIVVLIIGRITIYFYKNINLIKINTNASVEYTKFNSYFTDEINIEGNEVIDCTEEYIIFSKTRNQYTYKNNCIYVNKAKLCENIELCQFNYNKENKKIQVNLTIQAKNYNTIYTVAK